MSDSQKVFVDEDNRPNPPPDFFGADGFAPYIDVNALQNESDFVRLLLFICTNQAGAYENHPPHGHMK